MKNMTLGIVLIIAGLLLAALGSFLVFNAGQASKNETRNNDEQSVSETPLPTRNANEQKGDNFENFVISRFDEKYFRLISRADDKMHNGQLSERSLQPDLHFRFSLREKEVEFSVECKFRSGYFKGGIEFASEAQLKRYKDFQATTGMPVFIVIGVGGETGKNPEEVFILDVKKVHTHFLTQEVLVSFKRKNATSNFFFDAEKERLK